MKLFSAAVFGLGLLVLASPCLAQAPGPAASKTSAEAYLTESVQLYEAANFEGSLLSAREALRLLNQKSAIAYNNICSAQMRLAQYELAIESCLEALAHDPDLERANNNLEWIYEVQASENPTVEVYLSLGEVRYWQGAFAESVLASEQALALDPESATAYNNLCAALAAEEKWLQAITACERALAIRPGYELATSG